MRLLARKNGFEDTFLDRCHTAVEKGLIEWTLNVEAGAALRNKLSKDRYVEIRYEHLVDDARFLLMNLAEFLGVSPSVLNVVQKRLSRRSPAACELGWPDNVHDRTEQLIRDLGYNL